MKQKNLFKNRLVATSLVILATACQQSMQFSILPSFSTGSVKEWIQCAPGQEPSPDVLMPLTRRQYVRYLKEALNEPSLISWSTRSHLYNQRLIEGYLAGSLPQVPVNSIANGYTTLDKRITMSGRLAVAEATGEYYTNNPSDLDQLIRREATGCNSGSTTNPCRDQFILGFGRRLTARAVSIGTLNDFRGAFVGNTSLEKWTTLIQSMLLMPEFLFNTKTDGQAVAGTNGLYELTGPEIARDMGLALHNGPPTQALLQDGISGAIKDPAVRARHVRAAFRHPEEGCTAGAPGCPPYIYGWVGNNNGATHSMYDFFAEFSETHRFQGFPSTVSMNAFASNPQQYLNAPTHSHEKEMEEDLRELFARHFYFAGGNFRDLMTDNRSFVGGDDLHRIYFPSGGGRIGGPPQRLPPGYSGMVTRAFQMVGTISGEPYPNLILRGRFLANRIQCREIPPPNPQGLPTNFRAVQPRHFNPQKTTRQAVQEHTSNPQCSQCHQYINPLGFLSGNIDSIGRQAPIERIWNGASVVGTPAVTTNTLIKIDDDFVRVNDIVDYSEKIADSLDGPICFSRQYFTYSQRREPTKEDSCTLKDMYESYQRGETLKQTFEKMYTHPNYILRKVRL